MEKVYSSFSTLFMECDEHVFTVCGKNVFHVLSVLGLEAIHLVVIHFVAVVYGRDPVVSRHSTSTFYVLHVLVRNVGIQSCSNAVVDVLLLSVPWENPPS
jgi:hypothetical protein